MRQKREALSVFALILFRLVCASSARSQEVSLLPTSLTFSSQTVGSTGAAQTVTLTNTDDANPLAISSMVASGDFTETNTCGSSVAAGASCTISVKFAPTMTGAITGSVSIFDNAPGSPQMLGLTGNGITQETLSTTSFDFGQVSIGQTSGVETIKLTNHSGVAIAISSITASADFVAAPAATGGCGSTLAAKSTCSETVVFVPTELGTISGSLIFTDAGTQQYVDLVGSATGTADSPITLTPATLTFGNQVLGTINPAKSVVIKNTGTKSLALTFAASGSYSKSNPASGACGSSLASGASCTIDIQFSPAVLGYVNGGVSVSYSGANSPQVVSLTGTAIGPVTLSPSSIAFSSQQVGTTSTAKTVTVTNNSSSAVTVTSIVQSADFTQTNTCGTSIAAGKSCAIKVSFAPTQGGSALGSVFVADSATNSPQIVDLSGSSYLVSRFAFVGNSDGTVGTISTYTVNLKTGQLRNNGYLLPESSAGSFLETADPSGRFAYAVGSGGVSAYTINASTGTLTLVGSPYESPAGTNPVSITVDPSGRFAYVVNQAVSGLGDSVSAYTIDGGTGALTSVNGSPFPTGEGPASMAIDPTGRFAYVNNEDDSPGGDISGYTINPGTGALTAMAGSPFLSGSGAFAVTIAPSGKFGYVGFGFSDGSHAQITGFSINQTTGIPTVIPGSPFVGAGGGSNVVVVSPSGEFVYAAGSSAGNNVAAFSVNLTTGDLNPITGSPFAGGDYPFYATMDPQGTLLYVTNQGSSEIWTYTFAADGSLTLLNTARTQGGGGPVVLCGGTTPVTYTPTFAYVTNSDDSTVGGYTIDASTGTLKAIAGSPFKGGNTNDSVAVDPSGRFAYTANFNGSNTSAYTINAVSGSLKKISGSPFAAGSDPQSVTVDPSDRFVYVANFFSNNISGYSIDSSTGALTALSASPYDTGTNTEPFSVAIDPSGVFLCAANTLKGTVECFSIDPAAGNLTAISAAFAGTSPESVAVDPSGRFVYVANMGSNSISAYTIAPGTAALTQLTGSPYTAGTAPVSVVVDPSGRFVYAANNGNGAASSFNVSAYTIDPTTGALTEISGSPFAAGSFPRSVTVDPSGNFVYVTNSDDNDVSAYTIDQSSGALTVNTAGPFKAGNNVYSVTTTGTIH
jgi:6-phosphogluconolactonase (cycloisomerase 2 family)